MGSVSSFVGKNPWRDKNIQDEAACHFLHQSDNPAASSAKSCWPSIINQIFQYFFAKTHGLSTNLGKSYSPGIQIYHTPYSCFLCSENVFEALPIPLNSCRVAFGQNLTLFLAFSTSPICSNASIYRSQKFTDQLCPLDHQPLQLRPREYVSSSFELKRK